MTDKLYTIAQNFINLFGTENTFMKAEESGVQSLRENLGKDIDFFIDFYSEYEPNNVKMTDSYVGLMNIEHMIVENTYGEPGKYLSKIGLFVFAMTVGGNPLCIDTVAAYDKDAAVYIADSGFCYFNEKTNRVEIAYPSDELTEELSDEEAPELTYDNAIRCLNKVEDSFVVFMDKLSRNEYEDLEEFLE